MAFKAIKNFEINGQKFIIGDIVPNELIEERLIRSKKVQSTDEDVNGLLIETPVENIVVEIIEEVKEDEVIKEVEIIPEIIETKQKIKKAK